MRFAVIGAGMSGILAVIRLKEAGHSDVTVYEKAARPGGTWRENTYPGIACDVPSHLYSYSFAPNPEWSRRYSPGEEIQRYFERVAAEHDVDACIRYGDEVVACRFDGGRWQLSTASGHRDEVDVVIAATGVLHHPNVPALEGLADFGGAAFHSARWDHDVELDGRRIGVIGTGSTAVQITSALVDRAREYRLFQRTAQWIFPQENPAYTDEEKAGFRADLSILTHMHAEMSRRFAESFSNAVIDADSPQMQMVEDLCRANLEENVADPELRELLRPDYRAACKRLVVSPDFYQAIQQPNAELVTSPIRRVEPAGVRTVDGRLHELDVLVLATGFRADRFMRPIEIVGRDGLRLEDRWEERPTAYLSISIPGFPNLFMLNGPNGPVGNFSLIEVAELQIDYILQLVDLIGAGRYREVSAKFQATDDFDAARVEAATKTVWTTGCRSWYLDDRGIPATWPWTFERFQDEMAAPRLEDYDLVEA